MLCRVMRTCIRVLLIRRIRKIKCAWRKSERISQRVKDQVILLCNVPSAQICERTDLHLHVPVNMLHFTEEQFPGLWEEWLPVSTVSMKYMKQSFVCI